jgi:hypothetical protein
MPNRTEGDPAKAESQPTGRLPLLRLFSTLLASLTTPALSIPFFCISLHALREERHFALVDGFALPTIGSLVIGFRSEVSIRPMRLFDPQHPIMITTSNSSLQRSGTPNQ